ncbi:MAG: FKBP-type peptidyl-prolyl cis-trans isomerase [Candidatus Paceibacterota bacterium]
MRQISKKEYIGITVTLAVALIFFVGINFWSAIFGNSSATSNTNNLNQINQQPMEQTTKNVITEGTGNAAVAGNTITVNYVGMLQDGTKFDSSYDRGTPFSFVLGAGNVIKGWDDSLIGAKVGEKLSIVIPPALAYGPNGIPDGKGGYIIPQNATLVFNIEVVGIK